MWCLCMNRALCTCSSFLACGDQPWPWSAILVRTLLFVGFRVQGFGFGDRGWDASCISLVAGGEEIPLLELCSYLTLCPTQ